MRESGYYWVLIECKWQVGKYNAESKNYFGYWRLFNSVEQYSDSDFDEIDERKIERLAIDENRIDPEPEVNITGTANYIIDIKHVRGDEV